ncbi:hypothetical protein [Pectobacterium zantedeschiae]|uniref:hypothetical protein n=1 Tax=Pectobacterium zantedeschiae TaxID=2034769 RepID=UPI00101C9248|nr:hypothetical protein [Pectobacterium zantedeschiae]RYC42894.1 hypothetical protein DEH81_10085 [Pectobacterium zantedeschiae]
MEIKDILTPLATISAVWVAARFTLRNELRKKELELKAAHLEKLSENCDSALIAFMEHAGRLASLIDIKLMLLRESNPSSKKPEIKISVADLNEWLTEFERIQQPIDHEKLRWCRHGLEFHREHEWKRWRDSVGLLQREMYDFFLITNPGEENRDIKGQYRTREEINKFSARLRKHVAEMETVRKDIVSAMANDFRLLTQPANHNIYELMSSVRKRLSKFLLFR